MSGNPSAILYYKSTCPYSQMARKLLSDRLGGSLKVITVDAESERFKAQLSKLVGKPIRTWPQAWLVRNGNYEHVGGYDALTKIL